MSIADVLGLLVTGDSSTSENGRILAGSILRSRESLDTEAVGVVEALASRAGECNGDLSLLVEGVATCSPAVLHNHFTTWCQLLTNVMQGTTDPSAFSAACRGVSMLLRHVPPGHVQATTLSPLLHALLPFSTAMPTLQTQVLGLLALCLVRFPSSCSQHRPAIKKWASTAVCDSHLSLAQEGSRVLVLLCQQSNQQWSVLMECVCGCVEWLLHQLDHRTAMAGPATPPYDLAPWVDLPTLPTTDPERTAHLVQMVSHLVRILCHGLLFPPRNSTHPPPVPLERVLALVTHGLKQAAVGHVVEALVLQVTVPVVHTIMWNMLCVLIKTCHAHLLPHSAHIMAMLMSVLCSKDTLQSPQLLAAVHRALVAWMGVARDLNAPSMGPLLRALISSSGHAPFRTSSLNTLAMVISHIGPLVPAPLAPPILQIPMAGLTPHVSADVALLKLRLLLACMGSGNTHLCPPTSAAVQVLTDLSNHHTSREVVDFCRSALSRLSLKLLPPQLSAGQPVTPPTSIAPPTTQPLISHPPSNFMTPVPPNSPLPVPSGLTPPTQPSPCEHNVKRKRVWPRREVAEVALMRLPLGNEVEEMTSSEHSPIAKRKMVARDSEKMAEAKDSEKMAEVRGSEKMAEAKDSEKMAEVLARDSVGGASEARDSVGGASEARDSVKMVGADSEGSDGEASGMEHFVSDSSMDSD